MRVGDSIPVHKEQVPWISPDCPAWEDTPILFHFWALSCPACKMNMPHLQKLREEYGPRGLQVVAVHLPRGEFDLNVEKVQAAIADLGITEPSAVDNERTIGEAFGVDAWPAYYLFDAQHKMRVRALGNFGVRMVERTLIRLFKAEQ